MKSRAIKDTADSKNPSTVFERRLRSYHYSLFEISVMECKICCKNQLKVYHKICCKKAKLKNKKKLLLLLVSLKQIVSLP